MKPNWLRVILSFFKVGAVGFGGGAALIPILESELVEKNEWINKESFDVAVAAASISPASLPVSICAIWNLRYSLLSAYFYALPGPCIFLILLTGFSMIGETGIRYIEYASVGILVFVLMLIYKFVRKNYLHGLNTGIQKRYLIVLGISLLLYCGNAVRRLIAMLFALDISTLPTPVFAISMLDIILILFFVCCFIGVSKSKLKYSAAFLIAGVYALSSGRMGVLSSLKIPLLIAMLVLALSSIIYDLTVKRNRTKKEKLKIDYKPLRNILFFFIVAISYTSLTYFISGDAATWEFAFKALTSSLTSFGGGEVYYAIADETFVQTDFIAEDFYLSRIMGIAGAMPGPVIVSILAGVGFAYGSELGGAGLGWMFGFLGISMAVTATALGALSLFTVFEILKNSPRLKMIIKYIMPVVCGVLISVALTLLLRASEVISSLGIHPLIGFGAVAIMFFIMVSVNIKYRVNDILLFLIGGASTLVGLSVLNIML